MKNKTIDIVGRFTSTTFENKFLINLKKICEELDSEPTAPIEVLVDLSKLVWMDLLEGMCLPILSDFIKRKYLNSNIVFTIYTPNQLFTEEPFLKILDFPFENIDRIKEERADKKTHIQMMENVFYQTLFDWKLIHFLRKKQIDLNLLLDNKRYPWNDMIFKEEFLFESRKEPERVLEITPILERRNLPDLRERIEIALKKDVPNLNDEDLVEFSHLISRLCENICDHAYDVNDLLPRTGAAAIRYTGKGKKKGLGYIVRRKMRKHDLSLEDVQNKTFRKLQIPERFYSFYNKHYNSAIFEIVVVDGGKGVYETLKEAYKKNKSKEGRPFEILRYAFEDGSTSKINIRDKKAGEEEIGQGLYKVKEAVLKWDGIIEMRSCQSRITFSRDYEDGLPPDENDPFKEITHFPGTQLRVLIPEIG